MSQERYILVGGGGFARELVSWQRQGGVIGGWRFDGFIDNRDSALDHERYGLENLGPIDVFQPQDGDRLVLALGDPAVKQRYFDLLSGKAGRFETYIHATAIVAATASIEPGVVLCPYSVVAPDASLQRGVALNLHTTVGHDAEVGSFSTLSSHVDITGGAQIGPRTFFGSGARVLPKVKVGEGAVIGAGTVVMRTVAAGATLYAAPAKTLKS